MVDDLVDLSTKLSLDRLINCLNDKALLSSNDSYQGELSSRSRVGWLNRIVIQISTDCIQLSKLQLTSLETRRDKALKHYPAIVS